MLPSFFCRSGRAPGAARKKFRAPNLMAEARSRRRTEDSPLSHAGFCDVLDRDTGEGGPEGLGFPLLTTSDSGPGDY